MRKGSKVCFARQVAPQPAVHIFDAALLPRAVGIAEKGFLLLRSNSLVIVLAERLNASPIKRADLPLACQW